MANGKTDNHPVGEQKLPPVSKGEVKITGSTVPLKGDVNTDLPPGYKIKG